MLLTSFTLATDSGHIDEALEATEAPNSLRAAFRVELTSDTARRLFLYDPRLEPEYRWTLLEASGEDPDLDEAGAAWGAEAAPDGRLFPDDLRASLGRTVTVDDLGQAWRVRFRHTPSANDTDLDVWAASRLQAAAWMEPEEDRFLRIDYWLPRPVSGPDGGRLTRYEQSYHLAVEPQWGLSYISGYSVALEAHAYVRRVRKSYFVRIVDPEFFFANEAAQIAFEATREADHGPGSSGVRGGTR